MHIRHCFYSDLDMDAISISSGSSNDDNGSVDSHMDILIEPHHMDFEQGDLLRLNGGVLDDPQAINQNDMWVHDPNQEEGADVSFADESMENLDAADFHEETLFPAETAARAFAVAFGMFVVTSTMRVGTEQDVKGDGNCFFYALIFGMFHLRAHPYYILSDTDQDGHRNLRMRLRDVTGFRRAILDYLTTNINYFNSPDAHDCRVHDSLGNRCRDFSGRIEYILETEDFIGRRLFEENIDYPTQCTYHHWADINQHLPVLAMYLNTTIVCYFDSEKEGKSGSLGNTTVAHFHEGSVKMHYLPGEYYAPPQSIPSICIRYRNGNHFTHIKPFSCTVRPTFFWHELFSQDDNSDGSQDSDRETESDGDDPEDDNEEDDDDGDEDDDDDNHPSGVRWCNENETIGNMGVEDVEIEHVAGPVVEFGSTSNHCAYKLATHQPSFQV